MPTILHKRNLTPNAIPTTSSLAVGELAINVNDGKVFVRRSGSFGDSILPLVTTEITNSGNIIGNFTGSLLGTASYALTAGTAGTASYYDTSSLLITASVSNATITFTKGNNTTFPIVINNVVNSQTASYVLNAVSSSYASNADLFDGRDSITFAGTGSNIFNGNQIITGTVLSTSIISGSAGLFTTVTSSQSLVSNMLSVGNYIQTLPVGTVSIPTNQTASYIYTSGSTNDLYFTQYQPGTNYTNTTRLRWIEGGLSTGLLHGGIVSTVNGTTTFSVTSGSGIVVNFNASTTSDPYPTIKYIQWNNFVSQSLIYSASSPISYIAIDENGVILQSNSPYTVSQYKDRIVLGRVLHQSGAVTNGVTSAPVTAYGVSSNTQDFYRAFGPLKVSGHVLAASGSTLSITKTNGDSYVEGRNYSSNPNIPNYIPSSVDSAVTTTKIFYEWVSGSDTYVDNNGGTGYTEIRPAFYNSNGIITAISPTNNKYTIQRVYWFPKSATGALYVYYGSTIYTTLAAAVAAVSDEPNFIESTHTLSSAIYVGAIVVEANTTDLTVSTKAQIIPAGLFRGGVGSSGGSAGVTLPGGSNHQIQFNDSGLFGGSPNLTFDTTTLTLNGNFIMVGTGSINIDGGYITGALAQFTTISGSVVTGTTAIFERITGTLNGTASYSQNANTLDGYNSADFALLNANNVFTADQNLYRSVLTLSCGEVGFSTKPSIVFANLANTMPHYLYTRHSTINIQNNAIDFYTCDGTSLGVFPTNAVHGMTIANGKVGIKTTSPNVELDVSGSSNISGNLVVTGSTTSNLGFTGSLFGTASYATLSQNSLTASYILTAISASYASNADLFDGRDSTTFAGTGSNAFIGNQVITGALNVSSRISGTTASFTNITSSQALIGNSGAPAFITSTKITTSVGNNTIYNISTALYDTAFFDYSVRSGSNARAGTIMAITDGSSVNYTETTTNDLGDTSGLTMGFLLDTLNAQLQFSASASTQGWVIKTIIRTI